MKFNKYRYIGDPINAVRIYNDMEVDELIFLDITATVERRKPNFDLIREIAGECFMPLAYGGGVRDLDDIRRIFKSGVEKVSLNSYAAENPLFIREATTKFGSQSIIVSVDVKKNIWGRYEIRIERGKKTIPVPLVDYIQKIQELGAGEILLTSIDRDGTWEGYDTDIIQQVSRISSIPLIACGGAGKIEDFGSAVKIGGASAVAAGSMVVYQGKDLGVLIKFPKKSDLERILG